MNLLGRAKNANSGEWYNLGRTYYCITSTSFYKESSWYAFQFRCKERPQVVKISPDIARHIKFLQLEKVPLKFRRQMHNLKKSHLLEYNL
jgi:hypothetical protein